MNQRHTDMLIPLASFNEDEAILVDRCIGGSMRLVYRSGGSTMWDSAEMSLYVAIAHLLR